ncbi:hypothetical protein GO491_01505 [Flavobacteriaceae bacterium Ap0902]|nr:hypothetical protein [Flavobacteriaceae bacterium Ap0902]
MGAFMVFAGTGHLTFKRKEFQAQVPVWLPMNKDFVVVASGIVEIGLGLAMLFWKDKRVFVGVLLALFYVLIFPGNINQYVEQIDSFGLDTDKKRFQRLFFQPLLVYGALWSTGYFEAKQIENHS